MLEGNPYRSVLFHLCFLWRALNWEYDNRVKLDCWSTLLLACDVPWYGWWKANLLLLRLMFVLFLRIFTWNFGFALVFIRCLEWIVHSLWTPKPLMKKKRKGTCILEWYSANHLPGSLHHLKTIENESGSVYIRLLYRIYNGCRM